MLNPEHPTAILRHAWRRIRLDSIRNAAEVAIRELQELERQDVLPGPVECGAETTPETASVAALLSCCAELREESGISGAEAPMRMPQVAKDPAWGRAYATELNRYRTVAAQSLKRLLTEPARP